MSPNEFQLRAALHDGEGDSPDADSLISHAIGVRRDRRRRITAIAGGTTIVAVVTVGVTALITLGGSNGNSGGGASADSAGSALSQRNAGGAPVPKDAPIPAAPDRGGAEAVYAARVTCPPQPDHFALPGGGGLGQFGSTDPLFAKPVVAFRVCGYPLLRSAGPRSSVVVAQAPQLARSLEAAPAALGRITCPPNTDDVGGTIELYPIAKSGTGFEKLDPVVITLACGASKATNGTAVRFVTDLPEYLVTQVVPAPAGGSVSSGSTPGKVQGSPVR